MNEGWRNGMSALEARELGLKVASHVPNVAILEISESKIDKVEIDPNKPGKFNMVINLRACWKWVDATFTFRKDPEAG